MPCTPGDKSGGCYRFLNNYHPGGYTVVRVEGVVYSVEGCDIHRDIV